MKIVVKHKKLQYQQYNKDIEIKNSLGYIHNLYIVGYPTVNCQISSIGMAENIRHFNNEEDLKALMSTLRDNTCNQILIDIYRNKVDDILKKFELFTTITFNTPYINTTGSNMNMILLKWKDRGRL